MRHQLIVYVSVAASALALAAAAAAGKPTRLTFTGSDDNLHPAGTVCDFDYRSIGTYRADVTLFADGREQIHWTLETTQYNLDTGSTLTESNRYTVTYYSDHEKTVGLFWHLRNPEGKIVAVHAGQVYLSDSKVKFTPNSGADFAGVLCPALGGNPAA